MSASGYVLITPARNEAQFIERTIQSVVGQTVRPLKWVIVSDGSTDETNAIVGKYAAEYGWIELVALPERSERHFAGKVRAFNAGYERMSDVQYDVIGNLDGDLAFGAECFEFLLNRFKENTKLGVAGIPFREDGASYNFRFASTEHVSGACQLFRRACFEDIGGYTPIREGGIDLVAVITARMKGWQTRTFTEMFAEHLKPTQTSGQGGLTATFRSGYHDYLMGNPFAWQVGRCLYQMVRRPYILGGSLLLSGYVWALLKRPQRPVSPDFVRFRTQEQWRRLKRLIGLSPSIRPSSCLEHHD